MSNPQKLASNTKLPTLTKYRNCCFTWNNPDDIARIEAKLRAWRGVTYMVYGVEAGEQGTQHLQGYCEFSNQKDFETIRKILENHHFEARFKKSTAQQAANYCKKGEQSKAEWEAHNIDGENYGLNAQVTEWGEISEQGKRNDLSPACEMIKEGATMKQVAQEHPEMFVKYNKGLLALKCILLEPRDEVPEVRVFYGSTGTKKSLSARQWLGFAKSEDPPYVWHPQCEKWFDGYEGQKKVIFEEFRGQLPFGFLLSLTDRHDCKVQYKGGIMEFVATKICFTSPIHPNEWYKQEDLRGKERIDQMIRRITYIKCLDESEDGPLDEYGNRPYCMDY